MGAILILDRRFSKICIQGGLLKSREVLPMTETRTVVKHVRLTEEEALRLDELAKQNGMSASGFIRTAVFGMKKERVPFEIMEQIRELNYQCRKIGTNINQIAHVCNARAEVTIFNYENLTRLQSQLLKKADEVYQVLREAYL